VQTSGVKYKRRNKQSERGEDCWEKFDYEVYSRGTKEMDGLKILFFQIF